MDQPGDRRLVHLCHLRHVETRAEFDARFFRATSAWSVSAAANGPVTYDVDGGEADLKVRRPGLDGTVTAVFLVSTETVTPALVIGSR